MDEVEYKVVVGKTGNLSGLHGLIYAANLDDATKQAKAVCLVQHDGNGWWTLSKRDILVASGGKREW